MRDIQAIQVDLNMGSVHTIPRNMTSETFSEPTLMSTWESEDKYFCKGGTIHLGWLTYSTPAGFSPNPSRPTKRRDGGGMREVEGAGVDGAAEAAEGVATLEESVTARAKAIRWRGEATILKRPWICNDARYVIPNN